MHYARSTTKPSGSTATRTAATNAFKEARAQYPTADNPGVAARGTARSTDSGSSARARSKSGSHSTARNHTAHSPRKLRAYASGTMTRHEGPLGIPRVSAPWRGAIDLPKRAVGVLVTTRSCSGLEHLTPRPPYCPTSGPPPPPAECVESNCTRTPTKDGRCVIHHNRFRAGHRIDRLCRGCGADLTGKPSGQRYCTRDCKPRCSGPECDRIAIGRGLCSSHLKQKNAGGGSTPNWDSCREAVQCPPCDWCDDPVGGEQHR